MSTSQRSSSPWGWRMHSGPDPHGNATASSWISGSASSSRSGDPATLAPPVRLQTLYVSVTVHRHNKKILSL